MDQHVLLLNKIEHVPPKCTILQAMCFTSFKHGILFSEKINLVLIRAPVMV